MTKMEAMQQAFIRHEGLFLCPHCGGSLRLANQSLACESGHCFDLSAKGYVNLAPSGKAFYAADLFAARRDVFERGFFAPLYAALNRLAGKRGGVWLDAGCGEGSGLRAMGQGADLRIGIDLAKEGVRLASSGAASEGFLWLVGNLAKLPLADASVDVLLNVLSPASYTEFDRVLAPSGLLLKVIPGDAYLQELRAAFFQSTTKEQHSAEPTADIFRRAYPSAQAHTLRYAIEATPALLANLVEMTPLLQNVPYEERQRFAAENTIRVTADFTILSNQQTID